MGKDVIIALDMHEEEEVMDFLDLFKGYSPYVKVGMELFYTTGPDIIRKIKARGLKVFLDLKLHDIPNTVKQGMAALSRLNIDMCNLHAAGSRAMMEAALEGLTRQDGTRPLLLAVTVLTSINEGQLRQELLIPRTVEDTVSQWAQNAQSSGLDGVVCSPMEAQTVKAACGKGFLTVTPGVRFSDGPADDQARITTPAKAKAMGTDYIVAGRAITRAADPLAAWSRCVNEFVG